MYYLIESEYVGPNRRNSEGHWIGDSRVMEIWTEPGQTNMSHEVRIDGWLGTTNDYCQTAHEEFETLEEAREAAHAEGFTHKFTDDEYGLGVGDDVVESWISEKAAREQWDAGDWFINGLGSDGTRSEFGITAETTDTELEAIVELAKDDARDENVELHGTKKLFYELRDELREE